MRASLLFSWISCVFAVAIVGCGGAGSNKMAEMAPDSAAPAKSSRHFDSGASAPSDEHLFAGTDATKAEAVEPSAPPPVDPNRPDEGVGPGEGGDKFDHIVENAFLSAAKNPLSTFSIDVDTASYSKVRMYLLERGIMPPPGAVRIEELVNYFSYDYDGPADEHPFAAAVEVAECPWKQGHQLVRISLQGRQVEQAQRPRSNLVFLIDRSGSMNQPNKLPLVKAGMRMLVEQLTKDDTVTIVTYASGTSTPLPPTSGNETAKIIAVIDGLQAGGSTAGSAGLELAYNAALKNYIEGGTNRVILCTDGDFNVGKTSRSELVPQVEAYAKQGVFMTVLGFGMGNHNDAMLEEVSNKGNGNYAFIDTQLEARKVLVEQMSGTLVTIAKDVKIQIEFNPAKVAAYRQIGYENRVLAAEDFQDDTKDAGEIGAGHQVTALYEIIPVGVESDVQIAEVGPLKYQKPPELTPEATGDELLTVNLRYKQPDEDTSTPLSLPLTADVQKFGQTSADFKFASAVAAFGMLLRGSAHKGNSTYDAVLEIATESRGQDRFGYRGEFLKMVGAAKELASRQ